MKKLLVPILLLSFFFVSCSAKIKEPEFRRVENFGLRKVDFSNATIGFSATWFNPNDFGLMVRETELDVRIDSVYIGKFIQPVAVEVNSQAEFSIPLEGTIALQTFAGMNLEEMIGKEVDIQADGKVRIGKAGVYITRDIHYKGRQRIDADLIKNPAAAGFN